MNIKRFVGLSLGIAAVAAVGVTKANAQYFTVATMTAYSCSDAIYGSSGTFFTTNGLYGASRAVYTTACQAAHTSNAPGSVVTASDTLRVATAQTAGLIANRISFVRNQASVRVPYSVSLDENGNARLGFAGGNHDRGIGVWVQGSITHLDNDATATRYDGNVITALVGIDKVYKNKLLVGLSLGYENTDLSTTFNSGNLDADGFIIAPYASLSLKKGFSVDVSLGYARVDYDQDRLESQTSEKFTASGIDANRYFGILNLNASKKLKKVTIGGTLGALYSYEKKDSFTETGATGTTVAVGSQSTHIGQARFGVNAGINLGKINPYAKITGVYDFTKTKVNVGANQVSPAQDDFGADFTVGVNLRAKNFTGTIEGYTSQFRDDWSEYGGTVRLRVEF